MRPPIIRAGDLEISECIFIAVKLKAKVARKLREIFLKTIFQETTSLIGNYRIMQTLKKFLSALMNLFLVATANSVPINCLKPFKIYLDTIHLSSISVSSKSIAGMNPYISSSTGKES